MRDFLTHPSTLCVLLVSKNGQFLNPTTHPVQCLRNIWMVHKVLCLVLLFWNVQNDLDLPKTNWTYPKQFIPVQNYLDGPKSFWIYKRTRHYCLIYILCYLASYYCPDRDEESSGKNRILCVVGQAWSSGHKKMSKEHSEQFDLKS